MAKGERAGQLAWVGRTRKVVMTMPVFSGVCRAVSESDLIAIVPRQLGERLAPWTRMVIAPPSYDGN